MTTVKEKDPRQDRSAAGLCASQLCGIPRKSSAHDIRGQSSREICAVRAPVRPRQTTGRLNMC
eukprot:14699-Eustigmatos_ZCMA.PRE.1